MGGGWLNKTFLALVLIFLVAFLAGSYFVAMASYRYAATPEGAVLANQTATQMQSTRQSASGFSIFINNFEVSAILVLPIVGLLPFAVILYNTGQVLGLLSAVVGISPATYFFAISPIMVPEMFAYSLLAAEASYVALLALARAGAEERIKRHSWKTFLAYVLVLFITALVEAALIAGTI